VKPTGNETPWAWSQRAQQVDALDRAVFGMVVMPADNVVFIGIRLLGNTIVQNQDAIGALDGTYMRLDDPPQVSRGTLLASEKSLDAVMAQLPIQDGSEPRCRGRSKRTDQVITIQVE
jgi:hypothetical protein